MIYRLLQSGKMTKYVNQNGELCFDRDELAKYRKQEHRGRPIKEKDNAIQVDLRRKKCEKN